MHGACPGCTWSSSATPCDRHEDVTQAKGEGRKSGMPQTVLLLPGSRPDELRRHLPVLADAAKRIAARREVAFPHGLPRESLGESARGVRKSDPTAGAASWRPGQRPPRRGRRAHQIWHHLPGVRGISASRQWSSTKTSLLTYLIARQLVQVKYLAMPNLLPGKPSIRVHPGRRHRRESRPRHPGTSRGQDPLCGSPGQSWRRSSRRSAQPAPASGPQKQSCG